MSVRITARWYDDVLPEEIAIAQHYWEMVRVIKRVRYEGGESAIRPYREKLGAMPDRYKDFALDFSSPIERYLNEPYDAIRMEQFLIARAHAEGRRRGTSSKKLRRQCYEDMTKALASPKRAKALRAQWDEMGKKLAAQKHGHAIVEHVGRLRSEGLPFKRIGQRIGVDAQKAGYIYQHYLRTKARESHDKDQPPLRRDDQGAA